jgi:hypothetical protein
MPFIGIGVGIGRQRFASGGVAPYVGLLDTYPNAAAAYSLRLLKSDYTGDAIRVRRASDNTEQNIGFLDNELDTSALTTFCSGTNGFVTTWYDQSGNSRNATQTTAASQPQIVSSGSVILDGGKPAIQQTGLQGLLVSNADFTDSFFVLKVNTQTTINYFIDGTNSDFFANGSFAGVDGFGGFDGTLRTLTGEDLNRHLAYYNLSGGNLNISKDGTGLINTGSFKQTNSLTRLLGSSGTRANLNLLGNAQEMIFYNSNQSSNRTGIETNINDFYSIY